MQIEPTQNEQENYESETKIEKNDILKNSDEEEQMSNVPNAVAEVPPSSSTSVSPSSAHSAGSEQPPEAETPNSTELAYTPAGEQIAKCILGEEQASLEYVLKKLDSYGAPTAEDDDDELEEVVLAQYQTDGDNADTLGDVPSPLISKTMEEVYEGISNAPKAENLKNETAARKLSTQKALTNSMVDKVITQYGQMRRHQAAVKVYELLNAQTEIANALMADEAEPGAQKGPIDAYFAKFKKFMDHLQNNMPSGINDDKLLDILEKIESPKENANFGKELAAMGRIGVSIGELEHEFRAKNEIIAEGTDKIGDGVRSVVEYQIGQHKKKELIYLTKERLNSSLPLKIILNFFGTMELAIAYLKYAEKIVKMPVSFSFTRYFLRVNVQLALITAGICIIQEKVAQKLYISGQLTHRARRIGRNFMKDMLFANDPNEIEKMKMLEGTPITLEQVLLLRLSYVMQRAQLLLGRGQKHLESIEKDFELINSVSLMTKSAEALAKLRVDLLSRDNVQQDKRTTQ